MSETMQFIDEAEINGGLGKLNGVITFSLTITAEKLYFYHVSELPPKVRDEFKEKNPDRDWVLVLKPYHEIKRMADEIDKIPLVIDHRFVYSEKDRAIAGWAKDVKGNDEKRTVVAKGYLKTSKISPELLERIEIGEKIDASLGGSAYFGEGGIFDGIEYDFHQKDITANHTAILPYDEGRCNTEKCGVNVDSSFKMPKKIQDLLSDPRTIISDKAKKLFENKSIVIPKVADTQVRLKCPCESNEDEVISMADIDDLKKLIADQAKQYSLCADSIKTEIGDMKKTIADLKADQSSIKDNVDELIKSRDIEERELLEDKLIKSGFWTKAELKDFNSKQLRVMTNKLNDDDKSGDIGDNNKGFPKPDNKKTGKENMPSAKMGMEKEESE